MLPKGTTECMTDKIFPIRFENTIHKGGTLGLIGCVCVMKRGLGGCIIHFFQRSYLDDKALQMSKGVHIASRLVWTETSLDQD